MQQAKSDIEVRAILADLVENVECLHAAKSAED